VIKQTSWLLVAAAFFTVLADRRAARRYPSSAPAEMAAGLVVPWMALLALIMAQGAVREFLGGYLFPILGLKARTYAFWPDLREAFLELPALWMAVAALLAPVFLKHPSWDARPLRALLAACVLTLLPAFYPHYFLPLLALGALAFFMTLPDLFLRRGPHAFSAVAVLVILAAIASSYAPRWWRDRIAIFTAYKWTEVAGVIEEKTREGDPVFVFPHDSTYYYLSGRYPPGRIGFLLPWTTPPEVLKETLDELLANRPMVILYMYPANMTPHVHPKTYLTPLMDWIARNYRVDRIFRNRAVMMVPRDALDASIEECRARKVLFADFPGWNAGPEDIEKMLAAACPPAK
jgi:hypothetical protein